MVSKSVLGLFGCFVCLIGPGLCSLPLEKVGEKNYYFDIKKLGNWFEAYEFCRKNGLQLFTPITKEEYDSVLEYLIKKNVKERVWMAGTNQGDGSSWVWMTTGQPINYSNWAPGMPDSKGGEEFSLEIYIDRKWNDAKWNRLNNFVCEEVLCEKNKIEGCPR